MNGTFSKRFKLLAIISLLSSFIYKGTGNEQLSHLSQTVPPDMIYIKGNDSVNSFYISTTEEPNINWRIYTQWLKNVFVDFPQVYKDAMPLADMQLTATRYNDPIIDTYANHPAYNYYPIVGVSWMQIQNYLQWKTDRLNETILIQNGFYKFDMHQMNENNFCTESYLEGQYDGSYVNRDKNEILNNGGNWPRPSGFNTNPYIMKKGIFIPHYRLPTEAEWDYASVVSKKNISVGENYSIYGYKYFLDQWNLNATKNIKPKKFAQFPNTNAMESGVQEWLMDMEGFNYHSDYGSADIYLRNGFEKTDSVWDVFDADGVVDVKDSLGKLRFIFVDYDNTNRPIYIARIGFDQTTNHRDVKVANPYYKNDSLFEKHKLSHSSKYFAGRWHTLNDQNKWYYITTEFFEFHHYDVVKYVYKSRKVKSGNWDKPSKATYLLNENEASELVGFRCVLPATSVAIDPTYKVKWE